MSYLSDYRAKKKSLGLCRACNNPVAPQSQTFCAKHLKKQYQYTKDQGRGTRCSRFDKLKQNSKRRGVPFDLVREAFNAWLTGQEQVCRYCGVTEQQLQEQPNKRYRRMTIDRCQNDVGYQLDNMCLACYRCNRAKSYYFTESEWAEIANQYLKPKLKEYHQIG